MALPVIDLSKCGLLLEDCDVTYENLQTTGEELFKAFTTIGFARISNTGISRYSVEEIYEISDKFFDLPLDDKMKFFSTTDRVNEMNYDPLGVSTANEERPGFDLVEMFRMPYYSTDHWPKVDNMKEKAEHFQCMCKRLAMRILKALGIAMKLKDEDIFCNSHSMIGTNKNTSSLLLGKYPGITNDIEVAEGQIRFGEHCDTSSLSMVFQDDVGGFQVRNAAGNFVEVSVIPDTILLNIGDILQAWSGGRLKSTEHRLVVPEDPVRRLRVRRLIALFILADDDVELKELEYEDSNGVPKQTGKIFTAKEFQKKRYYELYIKNDVKQQ